MNNKKTAGYRLYEDTPLGARLRTAFGGANNAEIARKLGVHDSTIHTIVVTGTITARMLVRVINCTGSDPEWLLTGSTDS